MYDDMTLKELQNAIERAKPQLKITTDLLIDVIPMEFQPISETPSIVLGTDDIHILWDTKPIRQEMTIPMNNEQFETAKEKFQAKYQCTFTKKINRVIFNEPATIVFWRDGTKTVSKCYDEDYDKKKGLLVCIAKGNGICHSKIKSKLKRMGLKDSQDAELCLLYEIAEHFGFEISDIETIVEKYTPKEEEK